MNLIAKLSLTLTATVLVAAHSSGAEAKVDFAKDIQPILQNTCLKCHGPEKQKGKLRLDTREAALKGGKGGPSIVAGDPTKSDLIHRVSLPKSDDDFMPSEGEPLTKAQIDLLTAWIKEGAVWPETAPAKTASAPKPAGPTLPADFKPSAAEQKAIATLAQKGIEVRPIAANLNWREANFRLLGTNITDATLAPVKDIVGLVDLNLANTRVTDAGLASLKPLVNLQRLHLELTGITDAGLNQIKDLPNLVYLNLYGTKVTDAGLEKLKGMKYLRSLYLWQTKTTEAGVKKLKEALPGLDISTGWDATALAKKEEKKDEKPASEKKKDDKATSEKKEEPKKPAKEKPAAKKDDKKAQ